MVGVIFSKKRAKKGKKPFRAHITTTDGSIRLGSYWTATEAARRYDRTAKSLFGEGAALNFPEEVRESPELDFGLYHYRFIQALIVAVHMVVMTTELQDRPITSWGRRGNNGYEAI